MELVYFSIYNAYKKLKIPIVPEIIHHECGCKKEINTIHNTFSIKKTDYLPPTTDFDHFDIINFYIRIMNVKMPNISLISKLKYSRVRKTWLAIIKKNETQWAKLENNFKIRTGSYYMLRYYIIVFICEDLDEKQWEDITRLRMDKIELPSLLLKFS